MADSAKLTPTFTTPNLRDADLEQCRLADPRVAAKNEHPTLPGSHAREQIVEDFALSSPSAQRRLHSISKRQNDALRCATRCQPRLAAREQTRGFHGATGGRGEQGP
jgi:hypothetical protein